MIRGGTVGSCSRQPHPARPRVLLQAAVARDASGSRPRQAGGPLEEASLVLSVVCESHSVPTTKV